MNKKSILVLVITIFAFFLATYQYVKEFQSEIADAAYSSKPAAGHSWTEMECTSDLCVKAGTGIGLGTDNPTNKLSVVGSIGATGGISSSGNITTSGSINATGDVCGGGACLSQMANYIGNQALVYSAHTFNMCSTTPDNNGYGELLNVGTASSPVYICRFDASSCPAGLSGQPAWVQYQSFSTTSAYNYVTDGGPCGCSHSCTTAFHSWNNTAKESCTVVGYKSWSSQCQWQTSCDSATCCVSMTGYATATQVGCY